MITSFGTLKKLKDDKDFGTMKKLKVTEILTNQPTNRLHEIKHGDSVVKKNALLFYTEL